MACPGSAVMDMDIDRGILDTDIPTRATMLQGLQTTVSAGEIPTRTASADLGVCPSIPWAGATAVATTGSKLSASQLSMNRAGLRLHLLRVSRTISQRVAPSHAFLGNSFHG